MSDSADKARQQAERTYAIAFKKIVRDSEQQIDAAKAQLAAKGVLLSSGTWRIVAENLSNRLEAVLRARLDSLLSAYELYEIAIDDEIEKSVLDDISTTRQTQLSNLAGYVSVQPWLRPQAEATNFISGQLIGVGDFVNEVKSAIEKKRHTTRPSTENILQSANEALIFVSCGQSTAAERDLGKQIARLVEGTTGCKAYFAENQTSFEGVTENVLKRLHAAAGFIAVMHPRGLVSNPNDSNASSWVRGSVWVEQEIAIAAFISQVLDRHIEVRAYVHETIEREGLRDKLHLNPTTFRNDTEILDDLKVFLPEWRALTRQHKESLSLKANIKHRQVPIPGGGGDDERFQLLVSVENDGEKDVSDFRLTVDFPERFHDEGNHARRVQSREPGYVRYQTTNTEQEIGHLYPTDETREDFIAFHYKISKKEKRETSGALKEEVTATVYSGNMKPKQTVKTLAELS